TEAETNAMSELLTRREAALDALLAVDTRAAYAAQAVDAALNRRRLAARARAYVTETVYGTLRRRGTIDWMLGLCSRRPVESLHPVVRNALRLAVYETCWLDTVPGPVACHEAVELVKRRGQGRAAGVVRRRPRGGAGRRHFPSPLARAALGGAFRHRGSQGALRSQQRDASFAYPHQHAENPARRAGRNAGSRRRGGGVGTAGARGAARAGPGQRAGEPGLSGRLVHGSG